MSREDDLIKVGGIETKRSKARVILDAAEKCTKDLTLSTDKAFANDYFCLGWQACEAEQSKRIAELEAEIVNLNKEIT